MTCVSILLAVATTGSDASAQSGRSSAASRVDSCATVHTVIDTTAADTIALVYAGRAYGEVVAIRDTIVQAITLWRPAIPAANYDYVQLYVMSADDGGVPDPYDVIVMGPVTAGPLGDGTHPVAWRTEFNPPLVLRSNRKYCFAGKEWNCLGAFNLLASTRNPYAEGAAWEFTHAFYCSELLLPDNHGGNIDLCLDIEYCDTSTATQRQSWGQIKMFWR
jgi:hypothetical protein